MAAAVGGTANVESGTYTGTYGAYVWSSGGTINISGGSYTGTQAALFAQTDTKSYQNAVATINVTGGEINGALKTEGNATINISGGTFTNVSFSKGAGTSINITGGTFDKDPSAYLAEGYTAYQRSDGKWVVVSAADAVASITDDVTTKYYATLADALDSIPADNGSDVTIKLLRDIQLPWSEGKFALNVNKDHVIIDGKKSENENYTISTDGSSDWDKYKDARYGQYNLIQVSGKNVTVQNVTVDGGSEYRGVSCMTTVGGENVTYQNVTYTGRGSGHYYGTAKGTLTFDGCTINTKGYAIHCSGGGTAYDLLIKDCSLYGWNSCGSASSLTIRGTKFYGANDEGKNGLLAMLRPYCPTTITNCEFSTDYTNNESPYTGLTTGAAVTVTLNNCTMLDNSDVTAIVDYDAFEGDAAANGSVFAFDATKDGDNYTGGTFVTKSTVSPIADGYKAYPIAKNVYKVLADEAVTTDTTSTAAASATATATEGTTEAKATEVKTTANSDVVSYEVELTTTGSTAAAETVYVAPPAVNVNNALATTETTKISDTKIAELVASVAAKAVNEDNSATTTEKKAAAAQDAVNSITGYAYGSKAGEPETSPTTTTKKTYDVVPTVTATKTETVNNQETTTVLGTVEITNAQVPANANIGVTLENATETADTLVKVTHYVGSVANSDISNWSAKETFYAKTDSSCNLSFKVDSFSKFTVESADMDKMVAEIVDTGILYDNYKEAFDDAVASGNTVTLLKAGNIVYTLADGRTLTVNTNGVQDVHTFVVKADNDPADANVDKYYIEASSNDNVTITFKSIKKATIDPTAVGASGFNMVYDTLDNAQGVASYGSYANEITFIKDSFAVETGKAQYIVIPLMIESGEAGFFKGVDFRLGSTDKYTLAGFVPANKSVEINEASSSTYALVPTNPDYNDFAYGEVLGHVIVAVDSGAAFNGATDTLTITGNIAYDEQLSDLPMPFTNSYTIPIGYKVTVNAVMDDTLKNANTILSSLTIGKNTWYKNDTLNTAVSTSEISATTGGVTPFATVQENYYTESSNVLVNWAFASGMDAKYQFKNITAPTSTSVDNEAHTFSAAAEAQTVTVHFEAKTFTITFDGNLPTTAKGYPGDAQGTVNFNGETGVRTQTVKYNVETNLNKKSDLDTDYNTLTAGDKLNTATLKGWTFKGWTQGTGENYTYDERVYTDDSAAFTLYSANNAVSASDTTVYAKWGAQPYKIYLAYNVTEKNDWAGNANEGFGTGDLRKGNDTDGYYAELAYVGANVTDDQTVTSVAAIDAYETGDTAKYRYTVELKSKNTATDRNTNKIYDNDIDAGGTVTISSKALAKAGIQPGSSVYVYVYTQINATVNAYPLSNNVVLVTATNAAGKELKYYGERMLVDARYTDTTQVMLVDYSMGGYTGGLTGVETAISNSENFSANAYVENYQRDSARTAITTTADIAAGNYNVNGSSDGKVDIVDITLVYNAYKGTYSYAANPAKGGRLSASVTQYLLSDVTFTKGTAPTYNASAPVNAWSEDTNAQLINMLDVKEEYKQAYTTNGN